MKDQEFFITEESFSRAKKQLKKVLKNEGLDISLSKSANIIAKSFGYNDEHDIQSSFKKTNKKLINNKDNEIKSNAGWIIDEIAFNDVNGNGPYWAYSSIPSDQLELKYFNALIKIMDDASVYIKSIIEIIFEIVFSKKYQNHQQEIMWIMKNLNLMFSTVKYVKKNKEQIYKGEIDVMDLFMSNEIDIVLFSRFRHTLEDLYKILKDERIRHYSKLMNDFHNIENYYYHKKDKRKDYYLQPQNFKDELSVITIEEILA